MGKAFVVYKNSDSSIVAYYRYTYEQTADSVAPDPGTQPVLEIPLDHPALSNKRK